VCVAYLWQKSRANFRSTKVDAGNLKRKYLNRPRSTLAVNVLKHIILKHSEVFLFPTILTYVHSHLSDKMKSVKPDNLGDKIDSQDINHD
jgi:hypothetical protein